MLKTRIEQSDKTASLVLEGEMVIEHAEELKRVLLEALENGSGVEITMEHVDKVDLFGLQVLCSAHRSALKTGKMLALAGELPEALRDAIVMTGYDGTVACSSDKTCPWNAR